MRRKWSIVMVEGGWDLSAERLGLSCGPRQLQRPSYTARAPSFTHGPARPSHYSGAPALPRPCDWRYTCRVRSRSSSSAIPSRRADSHLAPDQRTASLVLTFGYTAEFCCLPRFNCARRAMQAVRVHSLDHPPVSLGLNPARVCGQPSRSWLTGPNDAPCSTRPHGRCAMS